MNRNTNKIEEQYCGDPKESNYRIPVCEGNIPVSGSYGN